MKSRRFWLRFIITSRLLLTISLVIVPGYAMGFTNFELNAINEDRPLYDPNECDTSGGAATTGSSSATGSDNEQKVWTWLTGQGLSGAAAAGIMGNLMQESGFDPTIIQGGGNSNNPAAAGSGGWGLVQWTPGAKVLLDVKGAGATGAITDIATQLQIMWWEAEGNGQWAGQGNTIQKIKAVSGNDNAAAENVASIFVNDYEHAGIVGPRGADADQILATAKAKNWPNANASSSTGGSGSSGGASTAGSTSSAASCCPTPQSADGTFAQLTGDAAISGTFILGFDASTSKSAIEAVFKKYKPAGLYVLNTTDAAKAGFTSAFFKALATDANHPIIAASDEEGLFTRYTYNFSFPSAGTMSNTMSVKQIQDKGAQVAKAMAANGLNTDLAPVADVGTGNNSDFHAQPGRTFGTNSRTVSVDAEAFANGLSTGGIKPVYKHFPGLGSSTGNTDTQSVTSPSLAQLEGSDLVPYLSVSSQQDIGVMMDNAHVPGLTGGDVASTSTAAVSLLRGKYGFNGLIMTDDLVAKSVGLAPDAALAKALEAGVDAPLEKYSSDAVLDSAIAKAKAANVITKNALGLLDAFVPKDTATSASGIGASCCPPAGNTAAGSGKYAALVGAGASFAGVDQGIDFVPAGSKAFDILAVGSGTITLADQTGHIFGRTTGQAEIIEKLDQKPSAPSSSQFVYYAEIIKIANGIKVGAHIPKGTLIGTNDQSPGIEVGWAPSGTNGFMCPIGYPTPCGTSFDAWVQAGGGTDTGGSSTAGQTCTTGSGKMTNPFPGGWIPNRLDMGYDGTFKGQIVAPFDGVVQFSGMTSGWNGSYMVVIKASGNVGLPNSQSLYFTEGVKPLVPNNGQTIKAGTPIASAYPSPYGDAYATTADGSGQIEWGVADDKSPLKVQPNTEAVVIGFPGNCSPSTASKKMVLDFYSAIKSVVPGTATQQNCAGAN